MLEDGRVPAKEAKTWKSEGQKRSQRKDTSDCGISSKREDSWHKNVGGTSPKVSIMKERGALLKEEGDIVREYKAMHEENFMRNWLGEDVEK